MEGSWAGEIAKALVVPLLQMGGKKLLDVVIGTEQERAMQEVYQAALERTLELTEKATYIKDDKNISLEDKRNIIRDLAHMLTNNKKSACLLVGAALQGEAEDISPIRESFETCGIDNRTLILDEYIFWHIYSSSLSQALDDHAVRHDSPLTGFVVTGRLRSAQKTLRSMEVEARKNSYVLERINTYVEILARENTDRKIVKYNYEEHKSCIKTINAVKMIEKNSGLDKEASIRAQEKIILDHVQNLFKRDDHFSGPVNSGGGRVPHIEMHIEGSNAGELADEIKAFFRAEFGVDPTETGAARSGYRSTVPERDIDPIAVASLVLAIPGAILAAGDLAQRYQVKGKLDKLRSLLKQKLSPGNRVSLLNSKGKQVYLDSATAQQVLDVAEEGESDE